MKHLLAIIVYCIATSASMFASEEGFAGFHSLDITTLEIPRAGKVKISANAENGPISRFSIRAFDKDFKLSDSDLKLLARFPLSSMVITHGPGYELLGGYTVSFKFRSIYYDSEKKLRDETATISVSEKKGLMTVDVRDTK